jgi:hypothetical protein
MDTKPEKASQTFKKGAPLVDDGSGYLQVGAADLTTGLVGFALSDGHNSASNGLANVQYVLPLPQVIFRGELEDQANFNHVLAQTDLYGLFALQTDPASKAWFLDENDTANGICRVIDFLDAVGTTKAQVLFTVVIDATVYGT